jgi:hypothetical protein
MVGDVDYVPSEDEISLQHIRRTWDTLMRTNTPWDHWGTFDKWLLEQERSGKPVATFCKWFMSDTFRRSSIGNWTPTGKKGQWSFKYIYPQAFPISDEQAPQTDVETPLAQRMKTWKPLTIKDRKVVKPEPAANSGGM